MKVHIRASGGTRKYLDNEKTDLKLESGSTVSTLFQKLKKPQNEIWMASVNGKIANENTVLNEGDLVNIFEAVPGG